MAESDSARFATFRGTQTTEIQPAARRSARLPSMLEDVELSYLELGHHEMIGYVLARLAWPVIRRLKNGVL